MDDITLMTNNPRKHKALQAAGITTTPEKHLYGVTPSNVGYLLVKANQGHELSAEELQMLAAQSPDCGISL